jgi:hypothetical protein
VPTATKLLFFFFVAIFGTKKHGLQRVYLAILAGDAVQHRLLYFPEVGQIFVHGYGVDDHKADDDKHQDQKNFKQSVKHVKPIALVATILDVLRGFVLSTVGSDKAG